MPKPNLPTTSQSIIVGSGSALFELENDAGDLEGGEFYFGSTPGIAFSVESETLEVPDDDTPFEETLVEIITKLVRAGNLSCKNVSLKNQSLFFLGESSTHTQAGGAVTDEDKAVVNPGSYIQLGSNSSNPGGVRGVSAVTVKSKEGDDAVAWGNGAAKAAGAVVIPGTPNSHWYMAMTAGTTGGSEPPFPTDGSTMVDNDITWQDMGLITYVADTDYELDATLGRVFMMLTGAFATAHALAAAISIKIGVRCDYTKAANSRDHMQTGGRKSVVGALRIIADNTTGPNNDYYCPKVTLVPTGDFALKSRTDSQAMEWEVKIGKREGYEQLYVDGRAA